ncbi:MAG: type I DNA topoisomerase [Planctomycetaceae bacterium]|nr:type I DNA topoisomerase [Planctomycetaceae bacterium]
MAKRSSSTSGTPLVIVESPAKARTISKFLGRGYTIEASIGHIRDLPQGAKEVPEPFKKEDWAYLGVNVSHDFEPLYVIPHEKAQQVRKLKSLLKDASELYLATDEDREGEAISWHLCEVLKPKVPVHRLVFHEITEEAIRGALNTPRQIDDNLVRAQEVRRVVDRLYGYDVSPLLWRKIRPRLSAGRVQSVAVRLIVERERQRMAFVSATFWDLLGNFADVGGQKFQAPLVSVSGRRVPASRDFDPATGRLKDDSLLLLNQQQADELRQRLMQGSCRVASVEDKPYTTRPYPPFTTSTLQQEANRKYGFTARHTMQVAQSLYENGHITYMRTDSTTLASVAVDAARRLVASQYGAEYLPNSPRLYQTKVKNAQEAHEAIRPAGHPFDFPETLRGRLTPDEFKLYDLIWKRTIASQMNDARCRRVTIGLELDDARFEASGKTIEFPGYLRAYVEGSDDPESELNEREAVLPPLSVGQSVRCVELESKSHTTQPPNRYSEASLTRALEEMGIGRPSTYASIIETILARDYVFKLKRGNVLVPTWTAFAVSQLLEAHLPNLVNYQFTAEMEDELDAISRGEMNYVDYLRGFYFGNGQPGLKQLLKDKVEQIDARSVCRVSIGKPQDGSGEEIFVRVGRYGPFLEQGERRASLPDQLPPDELTLSSAQDMLDKAQQGDQPLGVCPETGRPIFVKVGRFGPYVQRGTADDDEKPQNASLLKGMEPDQVTLEIAVQLLSLPKTLGNDPASGEPVVAHNGRYGPYVKCGEETRSLPADYSPLTVTLEQALQLLAQPKVRRGASTSKEPLQVFDASPVTDQPVRLMKGRYGPYVTDGVTNASIPRDMAPEDVTKELALDLLAKRAAAGPSKRATRKKAAAPKPKSKAVKKKAAKPRAKKAKKKTAD